MPSTRFLRKSRTVGKEPRRMSMSVIEILIGNAALPEVVQLIQPSDVVGAGGQNQILVLSDTKDTISSNAVCKYINVRMQLGQNDTNTNGWYEYAVFLSTEEAVPPTNGGFTPVNLQTVGDIAINAFRGKCIWNGAVPINQDQAKVLDLSIKIPNKWCKWQRGQFLTLIHYYRPTDAIDNDTIKVIVSTQWKAYL